MIVETKYGKFDLIKNERDAFDLAKFEDKYLPEYFDKYQYLVGDLADEILRLKGFTIDSKSPAFFHYIPEYITEGCAYNCKYYILKRVKDGAPQQEEVEEPVVEETEAPAEEDNQSPNKQNKKKKYYRFRRHNKKPGEGNGKAN